MILSFKNLPQRKLTRFSLDLDATAVAALATRLDLMALRKLRFAGTLTPISGTDWQLDAKLGATVVQPCRVTLDPVTTRLDETVTRRYVAHFTPPAETEAEMPEDDTQEPLPSSLDLVAVMEEALALALPAFPRGDAPAQSVTTAAPAGVAPITKASAKPFAGLAGLRAQLGQKSSDSSDA